MPNSKPVSAASNRVLVKVRPSTGLRAAESRANMRPLYDTPPAMATPFSVGAEPQWFIADLPDGGPTPWDLAHARVADQLGVAETDVVFVEPDLMHTMFPDDGDGSVGRGLAVGEQCEATPQDGSNGKATGPGDAWHLDDRHSQLAAARAAVAFTDPRTRIAHLDTGYYRAHITVPRCLRRDLERNFVDSDNNPGSAQDPDNRLLVLDNSGHGTGTLSILAGGKVPDLGDIDMGGAPEAEVVPLRIADSVVLLYTSAFARALAYAVDNLCDVVSMSMGGLPSEAWREVVDRAYLAGICIVTAAGNNFAGLPTRHVVYPAHYGRVIAACGVMADGRPYVHLQHGEMEGNFGPRKSMDHALAAYTPNIPWAVFGCPTIVRRNGAGTSAATPQVAAAAALWLERYKSELPRDWRRVEAVRKALFTSAEKDDLDELGNGVLRAAAALDVRPDLTLQQTTSDADAFAFLRVITGLGIAEASPRERMFNLELAQRWLLNPELQEIVPNPDDTGQLDGPTLERFMQAIIEDGGASAALRKHVATRYPIALGKSAPRTERAKDVIAAVLPACDAESTLYSPPYRRLRVYATDPSLSARFDTAGINDVTIKVRWEELKRGPVGEYLAVEDVDAADKRYRPVNLDDPRLLAQDGWAPSEGNPQFHQQMVYAVSMQSIEHFERALGRPVLWRGRQSAENADDDCLFVAQLAVRPHALRQANSFYSPEEIALLFGYFEAAADDPGDHVPGSRVYGCLSHDIIAHETTHAILDGMHRSFHEPTNPDVLAFHEAFADIVALMQHFTIPQLLESEVARTRGDIEAESILGSLAVQFGRAMGGRGALRDAIGRVENGVWTRFAPDPFDLQRRLLPHSRGAVLVAAVFDAFITIYRARTADLLRISTGGTGVLSSGAIHPDLVRRLAEEAAKSASHVLSMCIRALDYLPPVDVTFFDYLRALITADFDLVDDDRLNYRVAFVEAFRRRGIYPLDADAPTVDMSRTLSVDTLRWQGLDESRLSKRRDWATITEQYGVVIEGLKRYADACSYLKERRTLFETTCRQRQALLSQLRAAFQAAPIFAAELGLDPKQPFEVHELRRAMRVTPDGRHIPQVIVALTQSIEVAASEDGAPRHDFRGGSTLVVDLSVPEVKYRIVKNISSERRRERTAAFVRESAADPLRALFFAPDRREPFAALHALADSGL